ncbi:uncharacterized protein LOC143637640 [Bidens hawaiensis]|uniref:uncharacterized protein LOC143637640 n=1 Tax=Bidens hawaiensis TaxID=980011 RepID=UPI00404B8B0A
MGGDLVSIQWESTAVFPMVDKSGLLMGGTSGQDVIALLPWDEWWNFELTKDVGNPHIALLPLHPDLRSRFNVTAAWEYAQSMNGLPYGYHNLIFSWIDTVSDNYPPPVNANMVASVMTMWDHMQGEERSSSFAELLSMPKHDDWIYSDEKSTSCVTFVLEMYKEAVLFGDLANQIQVTEFTIKDAYTLKLYENNSSRLPKWCNEVELPFCQIKGKYRMELPGYNTIDPYPHMSESCPSLPPDYSRPLDC